MKDIREEYLVVASITGLLKEGYSKEEIKEILKLKSSVWFEVQSIYEALKLSMKADKRGGRLIYSKKTSDLYNTYKKAVDVLIKNEKTENNFMLICQG